MTTGLFQLSDVEAIEAEDFPDVRTLNNAAVVIGLPSNPARQDPVGIDQETKSPEGTQIISNH